MNLVQGLPLSPARKAVWKLDLLKLLQKKASSVEVYKTLDRMVQDTLGETQTGAG
jgi:hypothetical protein